jgi:GDP-L-fucose synthase
VKILKNSKIFVAGHTGLLGSALVRKLKEQGFQNIVTRGHKELDLKDRLAVNLFFEEEGPEYVFLAAGKAGNISLCATFPATFLHENIAIQDTVFEAANQFGVKHLVYYGSSCTYPKHSPQPIREEYFLTGGIEETSEAYASAKIAGILACKAYNRQYRTNRFIALIPNTLYGPNDRFSVENSHVFSALMRRFYDARRSGQKEVVLWGTGNPRREFIFSEDVAEASIFAVQHAEELENHHYNIGTGVDISIRELATLIAAETQYGGEIRWDTSRPDGPMQKLLDSSKFLSLGWKPSTLIEKGLELTYRWFLDHEAGERK